MKILIILLLLALNLHAVNQNDLIGNWESINRTVNNGTETIEKEYLTLNVNHTFSLILLVSLKKDASYVKDLRIEVTGTWDSRDNTLVYVVKNVNVPRAKEVYLISQQSLENLAANFKFKYENDTIHMSRIEILNKTMLNLLGEKGRETKYKRY